MKPKLFTPKQLEGKDPFVRDTTTNLVFHRCSLRTLYADVDRSQVVYHANYLRYFEFGRASLMRDAAYSYKEIEDSGYVYPIIEIKVNYFNPLYYDDLMYINTRISQMERVRLCFEYIITHGETNTIICKGLTKHCALNSSGIPVEVDEKTMHLWHILPK